MALSTVWLNTWKLEGNNIFPKLVHLELGLHLRNIDDLARPQVIMWRAISRPTRNAPQSMAKTVLRVCRALLAHPDGRGPKGKESDMIKSADSMS